MFDRAEIPTRPPYPTGTAAPRAAQVPEVLRLQRTAGNAATARILRQPVTVQRGVTPLGLIGGLAAIIVLVGAGATAEAMARSSEFSDLFYARTRRRPTTVEWNAWGHCYIGYRVASIIGARLTRIAGSAKEYIHSAFASIPGISRFIRHNSLHEDMQNQQVGISLSQRNGSGDPMTPSLNALLNGQLQIAPADVGE